MQILFLTVQSGPTVTFAVPMKYYVERTFQRKVLCLSMQLKVAVERVTELTLDKLSDCKEMFQSS